MELSLLLRNMLTAAASRAWFSFRLKFLWINSRNKAKTVTVRLQASKIQPVTMVTDLVIMINRKIFLNVER